MTPSIAPLRNVAALIGLVERVQSRAFGLPGMATFYGPSGWGKTTAVTVAANEYQAYFVEVKDYWTPTDLVQKIMHEIGLPPMRRVTHMADAISAHLARTDRPLIIDDAQNLLRKRMIELVRDIYKGSQGTLILVGEEKLPQDLTRWENIHSLQLAWEPALACNLTDAEKLVPIYASGVDVASDLLEAIVEASGGSMRRVATNLARAKELAKGRGQRSVDLKLWANRAFDTGQPPAVRRVDDFRPAAARSPETVVPLGPAGKAARA